jgi:hypothetical protein
MRWIVLAFLAWVGFPGPIDLAGQDGRLPYEDHYKDNLLYLHALVGYEFDLWNDFDWERARLASNGLRLNYGSVSTRKLLTDVDLRINQPLGAGWFFLGTLRDYASLHIPLPQRDLWVGFEKYLSSGLSAFLRLNPTFDKELFDGELGLSLTDPSREQYLRLALQVRDFNHDLKNDLGGVSERTPLGVRWLLRTGRGAIWVTSDGSWGRGFSRTYDDRSKSPALSSFSQEENQGRLRLYYHPVPGWLLELSGYHYRFAEAKSHHEGGGEDYRYSTHISSLGVRYALNPGAGHGLRLGIQRVWQDSDADGFRTFAYERGEWLPALFYTFTRGHHALELGYMGSLYSWDFDDLTGSDGYRTDDITEKVKLGYTYRFSERGSLHLSLSHVFSFFGFGGGGVQFTLWM